MDEYKTWFQSQQGTPYDGAYQFAKAAWLESARRQQDIILRLQSQIDALQKGMEMAQRRANAADRRAREECTEIRLKHNEAWECEEAIRATIPKETT